MYVCVRGCVCVCVCVCLSLCQRLCLCPFVFHTSLCVPVAIWFRPYPPHSVWPALPCPPLVVAMPPDDAQNFASVRERADWALLFAPRGEFTGARICFSTDASGNLTRHCLVCGWTRVTFANRGNMIWWTGPSPTQGPHIMDSRTKPSGVRWVCGACVNYDRAIAQRITNYSLIGAPCHRDDVTSAPDAPWRAAADAASASAAGPCETSDSGSRPWETSSAASRNQSHQFTESAVTSGSTTTTASSAASRHHRHQFTASAVSTTTCSAPGVWSTTGRCEAHLEGG